MRRHVIVVISAVTGACFAALAGLSISELVFPVRTRHVGSVVVAVASVILGYLAFRAAIAGKTHAESLSASLHGGMLGALVGLVAIVVLIVGFQDTTQAFFAHALGRPSYAFSEYRLLAAWIVLGFGTGFVLRVPKSRGE